MTGKQSRLDAASVNMSPFLNATYALIPSNVSEIKYSEWKEKLAWSLVAIDKIAVSKRDPQHNG